MTSTVPAHLQLPFDPLADPQAVVRAAKARFTVLTPRLIRLEHSEYETFVDRPSQLVWYRRQPAPPFEVREANGRLEIVTDALHLTYEPGFHHDTPTFTRDTLSVKVRDTGVVWRFGDSNDENLHGTVRTLDMASGAIELEPGLLSRQGWTVVDDSHSLLFNEQGWLQPRTTNAGLDLYFLGYGQHYRRALQDYFTISGATPLLPRWALGNWWSRFWEYSQEELTALMRQFRQHDVPLSVCIVDMDWHITDTGNEASGWTGYTWNRELFPEPESFLQWLHEQGLKTALNLHPAEGVHNHEAAYEAMARAVGLDPQSGEPVPFDIADPHFARAYFEHLHHPLEAQGVDFWWIDWQQGEVSTLPGLDPLWWLNHLHFYDRARDGERRPFIFSRWGGLGNHRYPIGFSGDTYVTWESLAFQPYQTATAANVGFGWWSHDIGGHMYGLEEPELYARWVQFGVFSPIMRLHSTKNPYHERRPWGYDAEILRITRQALRLRHALIPYLYTMSWRNEQKGLCPVRPMYHDYPQHEAAYACRQQYTFGSELIAAPYVSPADPDTRLSRQVVWLPPGDWYGFFDGRRSAGDGWQALHGALEEIPVFARAGAIVPLDGAVKWGDVGNPRRLDVLVFPGADNEFELYEDDGETQAYHDGAYAVTTLRLAWQGQRAVMTVEAPRGDVSLLPEHRMVRFLLRGWQQPAEVRLLLNGDSRPLPFSYDRATHTVILEAVTVRPQHHLQVEVVSAGAELALPVAWQLPALKKMIGAFRLETGVKAAIAQRLEAICAEPGLLADYAVALARSQLRALLETICSAGAHRLQHAGDPLLLLWNNEDRPGARFRLAEIDEHGWLPHERYRSRGERVPRFAALSPQPHAQRQVWLQYEELLALTWTTEDGEWSPAS
ncbi:MAG TPA: TIM-barrel domain-containing protein [Candidatus Sulfomarinibacteraceae bacterium]|nr:TIM-barrel domain-containing protein [Candidatus Sulfomarinibacteraceae bacterium]